MQIKSFSGKLFFHSCSLFPHQTFFSWKNVIYTNILSLCLFFLSMYDTYTLFAVSFASVFESTRYGVVSLSSSRQNIVNLTVEITLHIETHKTGIVRLSTNDTSSQRLSYTDLSTKSSWWTFSNRLSYRNITSGQIMTRFFLLKIHQNKPMHCIRFCQYRNFSHDSDINRMCIRSSKFNWL